MTSEFNARKAAQVVAYLANKEADARLNILKAIKLVYLADRESIRQSGFPILEDDYFSMPHGPVNSMTLRLANGQAKHPDWAALIEGRANHDLALTQTGRSCDWDELSEFDMRCLDLVWEQFGPLDRFSLRDWTHDPDNIPEWEDPKRSSAPIPIERILEAMGIDNADAQRQIIDDHRKIDRILMTL